jgi:two-component system chemotaxis response regulator CheB
MIPVDECPLTHGTCYTGSMLRVLVAEDSATARLLIVSLLSSDAEITVVGQARNGEEAVALCAQLHPDVVTMDIQMPVMDGIEATRLIVAQSGTPVIMVSSLDPADVSRSMTAYNAGALAVLAKPSGPGTPRFEKDCRELIATVKALSEARPASEVAAAPPAPPEAPSTTVPAHGERGPEAARVEVIALVTSTGGPIPLRAFFQALPAKCTPPILIVQHIAAGFASAFAEWLGSTIRRAVRVAVEHERVVDGVVYVAPDDRHVSVVGGAVVLSSAPPEDGARPSGSVLLASLAKEYGPRAAGVLLTGTGVDGVAGLRELRDAGGAVFVQDQASCTTFETPRAALEAGVIAKTTPLADIPRILANLVAGIGGAAARAQT